MSQSGLIFWLAPLPTMSTHSQWALCLSHFPQIDGWSETTADLPPDDEDETLIRAYQAQDSEFLFLVSTPTDGNVRVVRCVFPPAMQAPNLPTMIGVLENLDEWTWLADEWAIKTPSVMMHSLTGTLAFVLDLFINDVADEKKVHQILHDWFMRCDEVVAKTGLSDQTEEAEEAA